MNRRGGKRGENGGSDDYADIRGEKGRRRRGCVFICHLIWLQDGAEKGKGGEGGEKKRKKGGLMIGSLAITRGKRERDKKRIAFSFP